MLTSEKDAYAPFIYIPLEAALGSSGGSIAFEGKIPKKFKTVR